MVLQDAACVLHPWPSRGVKHMMTETWIQKQSLETGVTSLSTASQGSEHLHPTTLSSVGREVPVARGEMFPAGNPAEVPLNLNLLSLPVVSGPS